MNLTYEISIMPYRTRSEASKAAQAAVKAHGLRGWKVRTWHNLGWHFELRFGPVQVTQCGFPSNQWHCLISDRIDDPHATGAPALWTPSGNNFGDTPKEAVQKAVAAVRDYIASIERIGYAMEDVFTKLKV